MKRTLAVLSLVVFGFSCKKGDSTDEKIEVDDTPVVRSAIAEKVAKGCGNYSYHYGQALKTLREAEEYKPGLRDYYVSELNDHRNEFLLASISPSLRKEWFSSHRTAEKDLHCMVSIFDELAAAAKRTLPKYHPRGYIHHESADEEVIRSAIKEAIPDFEELAVGVKSPSWLIEKHNNGIPSSRYKYGMAWIKNPKDDDGYCRLVFVNVVQDYAGGESYAASTGNYISSEPAGCK